MKNNQNFNRENSLTINFLTSLITYVQWDLESHRDHLKHVHLYSHCFRIRTKYPLLWLPLGLRRQKSKIGITLV